MVASVWLSQLREPLSDTLSLCVFGVGCGLFLQIVETVSPRNKILSCVLYAVFGAVAAVLCCYYVIGRTAAGVPRGYMAAGFAAGLSAYFAALKKPVGWLLRIVGKALALPFKGMAALVKRIGARAAEKKQKITEKSESEVDGEKNDRSAG